MTTTVNISLSTIKNKLLEIENNLSRLREEKKHLEYILENLVFFSVDSSQLENQRNELVHSTRSLSLEDEKRRITFRFNPKNSVKNLIVDILKSQKKRMRWDEIYSLFKEVRPEVKISSFRVSLSYASIDRSLHIAHEGELYYYLEEPNKEDK